MGLAAACLFSLAGLQVLLSLLWFFMLHAVHWSVKLVTAIGFLLLTLVTLVYVYTSFSDVTLAQTHTTATEDIAFWYPGIVSYGLAIGLGAAVWGAVRIWPRARRHRTGTTEKSPTARSGMLAAVDVLRATPAILSVGLTFAAASVIGFVGGFSEADVHNWSVEPWRVPVTALMATFVFLYIVSAPKRGKDAG
jgi:hypothetical protein